MIDARRIHIPPKCQDTIARIEVDEHGLPRIVTAIVQYTVDEHGESVLRDVLADDGEQNGKVVHLSGELRRRATFTLNAAVDRDSSRAWRAIESAIAKDRLQRSEADTEIFRELKREGM
jgi:hypothetical protein